MFVFYICPFYFSFSRPLILAPPPREFVSSTTPAKLASARPCPPATSGSYAEDDRSGWPNTGLGLPLTARQVQVRSPCPANITSGTPIPSWLLRLFLPRGVFSCWSTQRAVRAQERAGKNKKKQFLPFPFWPTDYSQVQASHLPLAGPSKRRMCSTRLMEVGLPFYDLPALISNDADTKIRYWE